MRLTALIACLFCAACSSGGSNSPSPDRAGADDLAAGSIKIAIVSLNQLGQYGCKVYATAKNTNATGERTPLIIINTEALSSQGKVLATGGFGIENILPGRSVNREFLLNDVNCSEIDHFHGLSGESSAVAPSPETTIRIET